MSIKKIVKQKQRQKQSVVVNVNLEKARARARASKRTGRGVGRGRGFMLPAPIYASPIQNLTPAMYGPQGQQIKQQSIDELLKTFLSNQQNQQVGSFKSLGAPPASIASSNATANSSSSSRSLTDYGSSNSPSLNSLAYFANQHSDSSLSSIPDDVSELTDASYMSESLPSSFRSEERTYLKASEPDEHTINVPKFSQNEARVSQGNIYESARRPPVIIPNEDDSTASSAPAPRPMYRQVSEESSVNVGGEPRIFRPRKPRLLGDYEIVNEDTDNPYPETLYNKMMGFTQS